MEITQEQKNKLRLLSDGELYKEAMQFIKDNGTVGNAQIKGLENIAKVCNGLSTILNFAKHQKEKRRDYSAFYGALINKLKEFVIKLKESYGFVPEGLSKKEAKEYDEFYGLLVAREFISHLVSGNIYMEDYLKIVGLGRSSQRTVSVSQDHDKYLRRVK